MSYVDDVGGLFTAYNEDEVSRECIGGDLAEIGAAEMARQFATAENFFCGLLSATENLDYAIYILTREAMEHAGRAREAAERHVVNASARGGGQ